MVRLEKTIPQRYWAIWQMRLPCGEVRTGFEGEVCGFAPTGPDENVYCSCPQPWVSSDWKASTSPPDSLSWTDN